MADNFQLNKIFTFNTRAPAILGSQLKNAKLVAISDYETALKSINVDLLFRQIYPVLPVNTPNQPTLCTYYHFIAESGERVVLADVWIDLTTVAIINHVNLQISLPQASLSDIPVVRDALNALGFTNFEIKQV